MIMSIRGISAADIRAHACAMARQRVALARTRPVLQDRRQSPENITHLPEFCAAAALAARPRRR
jgi:hypothetical protein